MHSMCFVRVYSFIGLLFVTFLLPNNSWSRGGDLVNNGGGLAERNVLFAYQNIENSIKLCVESISCRVSLEEEVLLKKISESMIEERKKENQIAFISEKKRPGTFVIDGVIKAAVTGSEIGSPIHINIDLLYFKKNGVVEALNIQEATAMLIHELGHHHGVTTHTDLDVLGLKVAQELGKSTYNAPVLPQDSSLFATFVNGIPGKSFPEVMIGSNEQTINLTKLFAKKMACEMITIPISVLWKFNKGIHFKEPEAVIVHNVHWGRLPKKMEGEFKVNGNLANYCKEVDDQIKIKRNYKFEISFLLKTITAGSEDAKKYPNSKWIIDEESITIFQIREPKIKILSVSN